MTVTAVSTTAAATSAKPPAQMLGQSDFIRLMTAQMAMQDPTDPVDNKEMIAQMAQFSSLSGIENVNSTLRAISTQLEKVLSTRNETTPAA